MDPSALGAAPTGIIGWVTQYGNVVFFFAQITFWLALIVLLAYFVAQYKRWVNYQLGTGKSGQLRTDLPAAGDSDSKKAVSVEEFVD